MTTWAIRVVAGGKVCRDGAKVAALEGCSRDSGSAAPIRDENDDQSAHNDGIVENEWRFADELTNG